MKGPNAARNKKGVEMSHIMMLLLSLLVLIIIILLVLLIKENIPIDFFKSLLTKSENITTKTIINIRT